MERTQRSKLMQERKQSPTGQSRRQCRRLQRARSQVPPSPAILFGVNSVLARMLVMLWCYVLPQPLCL